MSVAVLHCSAGAAMMGSETPPRVAEVRAARLEGRRRTRTDTSKRFMSNARRTQFVGRGLRHAPLSLDIESSGWCVVKPRNVGAQRGASLSESRKPNSGHSLPAMPVASTAPRAKILTTQVQVDSIRFTKKASRPQFTGYPRVPHRSSTARTKWVRQRLMTSHPAHSVQIRHVFERRRTTQNQFGRNLCPKLRQTAALSQILVGPSDLGFSWIHLDFGFYKNMDSVSQRRLTTYSTDDAARKSAVMVMQLNEHRK